jgi:hypothetical protein
VARPSVDVDGLADVECPVGAFGGDHDLGSVDSGSVFVFQMAKRRSAPHDGQ